ncbi:MAG TPA: HPF/RaiA family ribosome-associated protein [Actinomycetes bacterium]
MREFQLRTVAVHGDITPDMHAYARHKIGQLAKLAPGPVLSAEVKFDQAPDPAVQRPALVQATLDVNGRLVRAKVAARRFDEAIDLLEARLRHRLEHLASHLRHSRRRRGSRDCRPKGSAMPVPLPVRGRSTATGADQGPHANWAERPRPEATVSHRPDLPLSARAVGATVLPRRTPF